MARLPIVAPLLLSCLVLSSVLGHPPPPPPPPDTYDYIIIGGGGAGCMFANRLSECPSHKVLLLEQGLEQCEQCDNGTGTPIELQLQPPWDPNYFTTPQLPIGRRIYEIRFNAAGGATRIYGQLAVPASPQVLDRNPPGFRYADLFPYMRKIQNHFCYRLPVNYTGISPQECVQFHGKDGPMDISPLAYNFISNLTRDLPTLGAEQLGIPYTIDYFNPDNREGIHPLQFFRRMADGNDPDSPTFRESTWTGYLPLHVRLARPNLKIGFNVTVTKLIYSGKRVIGVEYYSRGAFRQVFAKRQVVLAAGAIASTQILELSGIGPAEVLKRFDIPPVAINPEVGRGAKGHFGAATCYGTNENTFPNTTVNSFDTYVMFLKSDPAFEYPNIEIEVLAGACVDTYNYAITGPNLANILQPGFVISFGLSNTRSNITGNIEIVSNKFYDRPFINLNWTGENLSPTSEEFLGIAFGLGVVDALTTQTQWGQQYITGNIYPADLFLGNPYLYFLYNVYEIYHLHASNPLGKVTNLRGEVLGVTGLTMCDLGVVPNVDANPTLTMLAMCEKIADLLLQSTGDSVS